VAMPALADEELYGVQEPRIRSVPPCHSDRTGRECIEFCESVGFEFDPWQETTLRDALGTRKNGTWAAKEVAEVLSRQNGKNATVEGRELFGLFELSEPLIIHTAHEFKASNEHFLRLKDRISNSEELSRRIKSVITSHGEEAVTLRPAPALIFGARAKLVRKTVAPRLRFLARSRGSGRSFTCNCLVWDEAMILTVDQVGASMPTMSAVPNPQLWYLASAGYPDSTQLASVRRRGIRGEDDRLAYFEWSIRPHNEMCPRDERVGRRSNNFIVCHEHDDRDNPQSWARANPALGYRITAEHVEWEMGSMPADAFDVERLGAGHWPTDEEGWLAVTEDQWNACEIEIFGGTATPVCFAVDITPDLTSACISVAWQRPSDGRVIVEIPQDCFRPGTGWVVPRLLELRRKWRPIGIAIPKSAPAAALINDAENRGLELLKATTAEESQAFTLMITAIRDKKLGQLGPEEAPYLRSAIARAETREIGDGMRGWSRKSSAADITPLTSATLAHWTFDKLRRGYNPLHSIGLSCQSIPCPARPSRSLPSRADPMPVPTMYHTWHIQA